jgi:rubrerythrin
MNIEEAIATAIQFEDKVHTAYRMAMEVAQDPAARRLFQVLADEEQGHITYLRSRLDEWRRRGYLSDEKLASTLPSAERIRDGLARMRSQVAKQTDSHSAELSSLRQALAAEDETSRFYARMVRELPAEGQELFARFLEIEEGHATLVQAEIDNVTRMGFWFDVREFDLERE